MSIYCRKYFKTNNKTMAGTTRKLRIFRIKDGVRRPYVLELDRELTVIAEYAATDDKNLGAAGRRARCAKRAQDTPERRIATAMARWVTESIAENPIPGTSNRRVEYFNELEALHKSHEDKKTKCPPCDIGRLMRRYRAQLEKEGYLKQLL